MIIAHSWEKAETDIKRTNWKSSARYQYHSFHHSSATGEDVRKGTRGFFGIVTTQHLPGQGYFPVVERQDMVTLHPIISRCVRPGTEVHSDDWASYRQMDRRINNVSAHQVVVHRLNFVNPVTGVHTQGIESCWNTLKLGQKTHWGIRREDMLSYLDE